MAGTLPQAGPLDLLGNEIRNFALQNLAAAPGSPTAGRVYYDTVLNVARVYNGSAWQSLDVTGLSIDVKDECKAVVTTNIASLAAPGSGPFDGYTPGNGDRLLLIVQSTASQNGIWIWNGASSALTRPTDFASGSTQTGTFCFITGGTVYAGNGLMMTGTATATVDTTSQTWAQFTGTGDITVLAPIVKTGNQLSAPSAVVAVEFNITGDGATTSWPQTHSLGKSKLAGCFVQDTTGVWNACPVQSTDANHATITVNPPIPNGQVWTAVISARAS